VKPLFVVKLAVLVTASLLLALAGCVLGGPDRRRS